MQLYKYYSFSRDWVELTVKFCEVLLHLWKKSIVLFEEVQFRASHKKWTIVVVIVQDGKIVQLYKNIWPKLKHTSHTMLWFCPLEKNSMNCHEKSSCQLVFLSLEGCKQTTQIQVPETCILKIKSHPVECTILFKVRCGTLTVSNYKGLLLPNVWKMMQK